MICSIGYCTSTFLNQSTDSTEVIVSDYSNFNYKCGQIMGITLHFKQNNTTNLWKWLLSMELVMTIMLNIRNQKILKLQSMGFFAQFLCAHKILLLNNFLISNTTYDDFILVVYTQKTGKSRRILVLLITLYNIILQDTIVKRPIYLSWVDFGVKMNRGVKLNRLKVLYTLILFPSKMKI